LDRDLYQTFEDPIPNNSVNRYEESTTRPHTEGGGLVKNSGIMEESNAFESKQEQLFDRQEARFEDNSIAISKYARRQTHAEELRQ
jgi:hypothetical protein